jgi:HK97 family phage major capsid protein
MAVNDHATWVPEEWTGQVVTTVMKTSTIEAVARIEPMSTTTKHVPREGGIGLDILDKGDSYTEDATSDDEVLLTARKFGRGISLADEDLKDTEGLVDIINAKKTSWASTYAKGLDNACLGTIGSASMAADRPFQSVREAVRTTDADLGYTADTNFLASAGTVTYDDLSQVLGLYEDGDYFSEPDTIVIASPAYKRTIRDIVDSQSRPIFIQGRDGTPDTLFGYQVKWTPGARCSTSATPTPTGNPLLIVGNRQFLILGRRSGPESFVAGADSGVGFLTDEAKLKMRSRRAFAVGHPAAFAVLEQSAGS